ncbi:MAG: hypothetical protein NZ746_10585 [Blastocatellia bacterium]|nr:hypothetical protein [Blastocatellia bacterium]MDW8256712.1 hypothetical protein [Acidobacteriota bacterium]
MRRSHARALIFILSFVLSLVGPTFAQEGRVEAIGPLTAPSVPESIRKVLEPKGYRVLQADGRVVCEIWFRAAVPIQAGKTADPDVVYVGMEESTFVGVIVFPHPTTDYRGQAIKPGAYTLRYALYPADGNHMGIAPNRDFLLLVPADLDQDATARYSFEELMKLSAKAAGTNHPAGLSLRSAEGYKTVPTVVELASRYTLLVAPVKTTAGGELTLALIVKGIAEL